MKIDLKTAIVILVDMQEHITEDFSLLNGARGMSDELSNAIDELIEVTDQLKDYSIDDQ